MKKTKDNATIREELVRWQEGLKEQESQLQEELEELNGQYKQLQVQEQALLNRRQNAASESREEKELRELQQEVQVAKKKCANVRRAVSFFLCLIVVGLLVGFGVLTVQRNGELEQWKEKLEILEATYQNQPEYQKAVQEFLLAWNQQESVYLERKEKLEDDIYGYNMLILNAVKENQSGTAQNMLSLNADNETEMRKYLKELPTLSTKTLETTYFRDDAYYVCREKYNLPYYGNISVGTNVIYPGAMIKGDTLFSGNYAVVPVKRGSMELVCNIPGSPILTVGEVNYGNVLKELYSYQELAKDSCYKATEYTSQIMHSGTEINASLGISVQAEASAAKVDGNVNGSIGKSYEEDKTNLLVTVRQIAYTVSAQPPQDCLDYFAEGADLSQLGIYAPAYISSVDYGRSIVIMISSEDTEEELKATIDATVNYTLEKVSGTEVTAEAKADYEKRVKDSKATCKIAVVGGNAEASEFPMMNVSNCMEKLSELLAEGEKSGILNPAPISYTLNYVQNNNAVPCVQITKEAMFLKSETNIVKLQWENNVSKKGTVSCEIDGVGSDTVVLRPNILSVKDGKAGDNAVYVITREENPNITINQTKVKNKLFGGTKVERKTKNVTIGDEKALSGYDISAVKADRLDDME